MMVPFTTARKSWGRNRLSGRYQGLFKGDCCRRKCPGCCQKSGEGPGLAPIASVQDPALRQLRLLPSLGGHGHLGIFGVCRSSS